MLILTPQEFKLAREKLSLTQSQMAERLGLSGHHVSDLERGRKAISRALALAIEHLFCKPKKGGTR